MYQLARSQESGELSSAMEGLNHTSGQQVETHTGMNTKTRGGHQYTEVPTDSKDGDIEHFSWKYFWRQMFISSGLWTPYFATGIVLGTPTIFIPQYRREMNSTEAISVEMASWISSTFAYAAVPWCFILAFLADRIGRKRTFLIVAFNQVLAAFVFYFTSTPIHFIIYEIIHGTSHAGSVNVCIVTLVECTSPSNRGLLLTIKSATVYWSIWAANAIGTFASWKYISILLFFNAFYSLTALFWPESPTWLASQGRYEECRTSHRWLRGCNKVSEKELEMLISSHVEEKKIPKERTVRSIIGFFLKKEFYCPIFLSVIMVMIYQLSGKQVVTVYAIDIIKKITSSEATAYQSMLILDGVSVFAMYAGCFLSKICKRRFMLFAFGGGAIFFLLSMSLYLYLIRLSLITDNKYVSVTLLVGFSISIGLGPIILATSLFAELIPLRFKGQATVVIALMFMIIQSILLKNTPLMFKYFDIHGMFLFYSISVFVGLMILYKYLPETKDKPLLLIEKYFKQ